MVQDIVLAGFGSTGSVSLIVTSGYESGAAISSTELSGGWSTWPIERQKTRKEREEEIRQQRIKLGILPPDPEPRLEAPQLKVTRKPVRQSVRLAEPWRLTDEEIERLSHRITNDLDLEIAIHLREIERRKQQMLALILILDAA